MVGIVEDPDRLFLEIVVVGGINIHHFLRIPVDQREPAALDLDHQPVSFPESVGDIGYRKFHCLHLAGSEGFGDLEAFPEINQTDGHQVCSNAPFPDDGKKEKY